MANDPSKPNVRLQVRPNGPVFREGLVAYQAGEVFIHANAKIPGQEFTRVEQLLAIEPCPVLLTELPTAKEALAAKAEDEAAVDLVMNEMRDKARKVVAERKGKLDKLEASLRKMPADVLKTEVEKRGLKGVAENTEARVAAILAAAKAEIEASA